MSTETLPTSPRSAPGSFWSLSGWGAAILAAFVLGLAILMAVAVEYPLVAVALPMGLLVAVGAVYATRTSPLAPLALVLGLAGLSFNRSDGIQPIEVLFALTYLSYFALWYGSRLWVYREALVRTAGDAAVALLLLYANLSLVLTAIHGGDWGVAIREWVSYSLFGFYFPVKEAVARYEKGAKLLLGVLVFLGLTSFVANLLTLRAIMASAEHIWEVARARASANEMLLLAAAVVSLGMSIRAPKPSRMVAWLVGFSIFATGVVITQWRAYYVSLALAVVVVLVLMPGRSRARGVLLLGVSGLVGAGAVYAVMGESALLLGYGLLDRALSIFTAGTVDISYLNRLVETRAVLPLIAANPILGHGLGTEFSFHDVITQGTWTKSYAHNGYLTLLFKFGIVGLGAVLTFWTRAMWDGWVVWRTRGAPAHAATLAVVALAVLLSLTPSFAVSNPFSTGDTTLCFTLLVGAVAGLRQRHAPPHL